MPEIHDDGLREAAPDRSRPYARVHQRTLLSGGNFASRRNSWGGLTLRASWLN